MLQMDRDGAYIMNTLAENTIEEPEEKKTDIKIVGSNPGDQSDEQEN